MKRKAEGSARKAAGSKKPKTSISPEDAKKRFRKGLFDDSSSPYKHAVIHELVDDKLLRSVRDEIRENIHQSGDLANLDGLDDESLAKLPSLLALRDAIYSETFRNYTDMAINIYTPGCYLLCHDDVIGSRRVSYILYLTDPDTPWKPEWGGALRLFPIQEIKNKDGEIAKTPLPDPVKVIPPAWNQLSFFAVQPGESFHDVEEDGGRVRMAISGWFHIPQLGEDGYIEGEEERNAKNSGLMQLQGNPAQYDAPQANPVKFGEEDLEFLLQYIAPTYLTPDTLEQVSAHFEENSSITLADYIEAQERATLPEKSSEIEESTSWKPSASGELLDKLLPSRCTIESHDVLARRFRRGMDYTLATGHEGKPRLELNLGLTPTPGWGDTNDEDDEDEGDEEEAEEAQTKPNGKKSTEEPEDEPVEVGGHEDAAVYKSSGDDDNILFFQAAAGALKFVKYVSRKANGDRWDISGVFEVEEQEEGDDEEDGDDDREEEDEEEEEEEEEEDGDDEEESFQGFSD
ncbi:hypothetical protein BBK36DRAFT_1135228 [Trichoderma citrinoviride]|uniref:Fe2OG dioxygenase domain-containing protein n=1 Tax=Trichoderma citrinoviride TaxID=58853 RepID=A0A2T4BCF5_9HYPO|nr:hypothetical protein BBK36DRAFT_1135228 [Trichoderma citrinoviride]PTB66995.1 hypothetical protein BBK36DRAFT_1135228 [Trichoderma citrinoviride]